MGQNKKFFGRGGIKNTLYSIINDEKYESIRQLLLYFNYKTDGFNDIFKNASKSLKDYMEEMKKAMGEKSILDYLKDKDDIENPYQILQQLYSFQTYNWLIVLKQLGIKKSNPPPELLPPRLKPPGNVLPRKRSRGPPLEIPSPPPSLSRQPSFEIPSKSNAESDTSDKSLKLKGSEQSNPFSEFEGERCK